MFIWGVLVTGNVPFYFFSIVVYPDLCFLKGKKILAQFAILLVLKIKRILFLKVVFLFYLIKKGKAHICEVYNIILYTDTQKIIIIVNLIHISSHNIHIFCVMST